MGVLRELFSEPVVGRDGKARASLLLAPGADPAPSPSPVKAALSRLPRSARKALRPCLGMRHSQKAYRRACGIVRVSAADRQDEYLLLGWLTKGWLTKGWEKVGPASDGKRNIWRGTGTDKGKRRVQISEPGAGRGGKEQGDGGGKEGRPEDAGQGDGRDGGQEKPASERPAKPKAGKKPPAPKKEKVQPEQVRDAVNEVLAGKVEAHHIHSARELLKHLTNDQIKAINREVGAKVSGAKQVLIDALIGAAVKKGAGGARPAEPVKEEAPGPEEPAKERPVSEERPAGEKGSERESAKTPEARPRSVKEKVSRVVDKLKGMLKNPHDDSMYRRSYEAGDLINGMGKIEREAVADALGLDRWRAESEHQLKVAIGGEFDRAHIYKDDARFDVDLDRIKEDRHYAEKPEPLTDGQVAEGKKKAAAAALGGLKDASLGWGQARKYGATMEAVLKRLPPRALHRIGQHLDRVNYFKSPADAAVAAVKVANVMARKIADTMTPQERDEILKSIEIESKFVEENKDRLGGCKVHGARQIFMDGGMSGESKWKDSEEYAIGTGGDHLHGIYTHELAHSIDGEGEGWDKTGYLSETAEWQDAFGEELAGEQLTQYGATKPIEGFAEFVRVMYAGRVKPDELEQRFPKCAAFMKEQELWPTNQ